jgi:hypothetical protein
VPNSFTLHSSISSRALLRPTLVDLVCERFPGQGEYDNVHIPPYVGFDDPASADATGDPSRPLVEAPLAADEVMHLHWRWGVPVPQGAVSSGHPELAPSLKGYGPPDPLHPGGVANTLPGAPLIPANQSLRIKIARPAVTPEVETAAPSANQLNPERTVVWYAAMVHDPPNRMYTQFFGHGFGLAYRFQPQTVQVPIVGTVTKTFTQTNADLLDGTGTSFVPNYHDFRWTPSTTFVHQRVPTSLSVPGLSKNRLGIPGDPNQGDFPPPPPQGNRFPGFPE